MSKGKKKKQSNHKREQLLDWGLFVILLLAVSVITYTLFYRQCVESLKGTTGSGLYHSDMRAYILEMRGLNTKYNFPYPIFFKFSAFWNLFFPPQTAVALATTILNSLAMLITKWSFDQMFLGRMRKLFPDWKWLAGAIISILSVSLFFVSMVYPPTGIYLPGIKFNYLGVFTPNPFHNATYMAARPFAILAFLWFVRLLDSYEAGMQTARASGAQTEREGNAGAQLADYLLFGLFLLLTTMTKPSFTLVFVGAAGLIMLYRLIRSKFGNLRQTILLGLTFLPTFVDLLYQYRGVFVPEEGAEGGIGFCFGRIWGLYCENIPLAVGLAAGFPILVLILNYKELKTNTLYRFSWQIYAMAFAMAFFLYEKGFREPDFNFSWGYMGGIFFAFFGSAAVLLKATAAKKKPILLIAQWAAFGWHLVCGVIYFYGFLQGRMYY